MRSAMLVLVSVLCLAATVDRSSVITLDVRNAPLPDVIALIARESGLNVVADQSVRAQRVTVHLEHVGVREALQVVAAAMGLSLQERDGVIFLGQLGANRQSGESTTSTVIVPLVHADATDTAKALMTLLPSGSVILADERTNSVLMSVDRHSLARARSIVASLDVVALAAPARQSAISYHLRFTSAEDVAKDLKALLTGATVVADDEGNAVVISGNEAVQDAARLAVASIDTPGPQVLFEVRVADVTPVNDSSDIGLEFGGLDLQGQPVSGATTYAFAGASVAVNVRLNALVTSGRAQILATPRLVTLNGKEADLLIGETYPVVYNTSVLGGSNVQFVDIGVKLRLTPVIGPDGSVTAELHPEYSELQGFTSSGYPIIANRKIDSTLRVRSGQTIVLGGLLRDTSSVTIQRLPWLSEIPIIGKVFQDRQATHERDEIVFLITPRIIDSDTPPSR